MASIHSTNGYAGDLLIFDELARHLKISEKQKKELIKVAKWGGLAIETWLEQAISKVAKIKRSSKIGEDFVNGWEAKKCTVSWHSHGKTKQTMNREACVGNLHRKHGRILIVAADPLSKELFYFNVPNHEIKGKQSITITFNIKGGAPTKFRCLDLKGKQSFNWKLWNKYRRKDFKSLCKA